MSSLQPDALTAAIATVEAHIDNAREGLPFPVFELISRLTPLVNVDLLIQDESGRVLLSWRDDTFAGKGWHIPGGIVRFKEKLNDRVQQVALSEIGHPVEAESEPIAFNQVICSHETRGHFFSLLFRCTLPPGFEPDNKNVRALESGYLSWHHDCPNNLVSCQDMYRQFIK